MMLTFIVLIFVWLSQTIAQNPNYNPSNLLPDILTFINGTKVQTLDDWYIRRNELKQLLDYYILGTKPPFPRVLTYNKINSTVLNQATSSYFSFTVDVQHSSPIIIELLCPLAKYLQSNEKFSLILSQYNHREWLQRAVQRRLFCGLRTPTADAYDLSEQFKSLYPSTYSWGKIPRRAWLNSIILNFMIDHNISSQINFEQIGITGHSRNGKQSLITAAYDARITAVVGSSSGMPIQSPFRYTSHDYFGETARKDVIDDRHWWCLKFQEFYGKENECPADGHFITAIIAPRHVMFANAINDESGDNAFANDQNYLVNYDIFYRFPYQLRDGTLTVQHRSGTHHGSIEIESYIDFFQFAFNRTMDIDDDIYDQFKQPRIIHKFNWDKWNHSFYHYINHTIPYKSESITARIAWLIGSDAVSKCGGYSPGATWNEEGQSHATYIVNMMGEAESYDDAPQDVTLYSFSYGGYTQATMYYPANHRNATLKPIIYLHPYSYAPGFVPHYTFSETFYYFFARRGYAVITLSQIGFGERQDEGSYFYSRYGIYEQSTFGHMVENVRALIDAIACVASNQTTTNAECATYTGIASQYTKSVHDLPNVDMSALSVVGYVLGGQVAIHAAALDSRIQAVASIAGFTPFRNNTNDLPNAGNYYYYQTHGLIPKLGYFKNKEKEIPYDYDELLEMVSPRKTLLYAPVMDKNADYMNTKDCITSSKQYWSKKEAVQNYTMRFPDIVTDFSVIEFEVIADWLEQ
eukprot:262436_1